MKCLNVLTMKDCKARIDSFYHGSAVDGEGLRSVLFFSGCNLRCPFCHNPETLVGGGREITLTEAVGTVKRYLPYLKGGGVTLSGGEPFLQADFCTAFAREIKAMGLSVIAETNGFIADKALISELNGVRLDVKNFSGEDADTLVARYREFLTACNEGGVDVLLTNVLIPEVNDGESALLALKALKTAYPFCRGVHFLPFRKLCTTKYERMNIPFPYADKREPTKSELDQARMLVNG